MEHHFNYGKAGDQPTATRLPYLKPIVSHYNSYKDETDGASEDAPQDSYESDDSYDGDEPESHVLDIYEPKDGGLAKIKDGGIPKQGGSRRCGSGGSKGSCDPNVKQTTKELPKLHGEAPSFDYETDDSECPFMTEKSIKCIPYIPRGLPASSRYLERFHIPHCHPTNPRTKEGPSQPRN